MKKQIFAIWMTVMLGACGDPEPREVNDENCQTEAILQWAEENNLSKEQMWEFSGKCFRRDIPAIPADGTLKWSEGEGKVW